MTNRIDMEALTAEIYCLWRTRAREIVCDPANRVNRAVAYALACVLAPGNADLQIG